MLERDTLYVLDYYKKNTFMGSIGNLNFRIYKVEEPVEESGEEKDADAPVETVKKLEAVWWEGPFIFSKTPEENKTYRRFDYSEEGLVLITAWINENYQSIEK